MARAFAELEANPQSAELSHAEWLGLLLDREATERYERRSLLITANQPFGEWGKIFPEPKIS